MEEWAEDGLDFITSSAKDNPLMWGAALIVGICTLVGVVVFRRETSAKLRMARPAVAAKTRKAIRSQTKSVRRKVKATPTKARIKARA
jgi:hypothetical protein